MSWWRRQRAQISSYAAVPFRPLENALARQPAAQSCCCCLNIPLTKGIYIALGVFIFEATLALVISFMQPPWPYTYDALAMFVYILQDCLRIYLIVLSVSSFNRLRDCERQARAGGRSGSGAVDRNSQGDGGGGGGGEAGAAGAPSARYVKPVYE